MLPDTPTLVTPPWLGFVPQNVAWTCRSTGVPAATEYEVEVKAGDAGTWTNFATVITNSAPAPGLATLYTVNNPHRWRVRAKVGTGYAAYAFDGGSSYISIDGALNQPSKTIAFWVRTDANITTTVARHIMGEDATGTGVHMGPYIGAVNNEVVTLNFEGRALHWDNNSFPVGIDHLWKHYAFVWQESLPYGYNHYVDGVEKGFPDVKTGAATGASTHISGKQRTIWHFGNSSTDGWLGRVGDLKVWKRALTPGEVT